MEIIYKFDHKISMSGTHTLKYNRETYISLIIRLQNGFYLGYMMHAVLTGAGVQNSCIQLK